MIPICPKRAFPALRRQWTACGRGDDLSAEIWLIPAEEIRSLNARERGVDAVTDVLSFPAMDGIKDRPIRGSEHIDCVRPEDGSVFLGSVVICEQRAREQAQEYGHSFERELWYLAVHGLLHCFGYDHETEEEKARNARKRGIRHAET